MMHGFAPNGKTQRTDDFWKKRADPQEYAAQIWNYLIEPKTMSTDETPCDIESKGELVSSARALRSTWDQLKGHVKTSRKTGSTSSISTQRQMKGVIKYAAKKSMKHTLKHDLGKHIRCRDPEDAIMPSLTLHKIRLLMLAAQAADWNSMEMFWKLNTQNCFKDAQTLDVAVIKNADKNSNQSAPLLNPKDIEMMSAPAVKKPWWKLDEKQIPASVNVSTSQTKDATDSEKLASTTPANKDSAAVHTEEGKTRAANPGEVASNSVHAEHADPVWMLRKGRPAQLTLAWSPPTLSRLIAGAVEHPAGALLRDYAPMLIPAKALMTALMVHLYAQRRSAK